MHGYDEVSSYTLYRPTLSTLYKQWQCIIQLLLPIPCWCIKCESYVRIFFRIYTRSCMTLVRRYFICAVLCAVLRSCGTRAELIVCGRAVCVTLFRRYLSLRSCLWSCGQVLGTPLIQYDTIRYDSVYLTCSKKLTGSQLSGLTRNKQKIKMWN